MSDTPVSEAAQMPAPHLPPWPMTIIEYTGELLEADARWLAFPCLPWAVPREIFGTDAMKKQWWSAELRSRIVGRSHTPTAAITDLIVRLDSAGLKIWRTAKEGGWPI